MFVADANPTRKRRRVASGERNGTGGKGRGETARRRNGEMETRRNGDTEKRRIYALRFTLYASRITIHASRRFFSHVRNLWVCEFEACPKR